MEDRSNFALITNMYTCIHIHTCNPSFTCHLIVSNSIPMDNLHLALGSFATWKLGFPKPLPISINLTKRKKLTMKQIQFDQTLMIEGYLVLETL